MSPTNPLIVQGPIPPTAANATWPNVLHTRVADVIAQMKPPPWSKRIIADERQLVTLIATPPGGGNRPHWHRDFDEWWVVLGGVLEWELTGGTVGPAGHRASHPHRRHRPVAAPRRGHAARDALLQFVRAVRLHRRRPARVDGMTEPPTCDAAGTSTRRSTAPES